MEMVSKQDIANAIGKRVVESSKKILELGDANMSCIQALAITIDLLSSLTDELLSDEAKPTKQFNPFYGADEISHLKGGTIVGIVDADSNDPGSGMTSDCLIIEIEKSGEFHELAFQDGEWLTLSFPEMEG